MPFLLSTSLLLYVVYILASLYFYDKYRLTRVQRWRRGGPLKLVLLVQVLVIVGHLFASSSQQNLMVFPLITISIAVIFAYIEFKRSYDFIRETRRYKEISNILFGTVNSGTVLFSPSISVIILTFGGKFAFRAQDYVGLYSMLNNTLLNNPILSELAGNIVWLVLETFLLVIIRFLKLLSAE